MAFDLAAIAFIASLIPLLADTTPAAMRRHAMENDANRILTLVVMAAISGEMTAAKAGDALAMAKLIGTLALIWLFGNTVYALHYAHAFYAGPDDRHPGGIDFPDTSRPDYLDFAYFAFTLGMTFQTSDVAITARPIRRVVLLHCLAAFVFNIGIIAFTINAIGGN